MGKNGTVIRILNVYNNSRWYLCFGLETTQGKKSFVEPVVNFNYTRKAVTDKNVYGTSVDSEESR